MDYEKAMSDQHNFGKLLTTTQKSDNPVWQRVIDGLQQKERGWRRLPNFIKACGHPGVRDGGNRCVFCLVERDLHREELREKTVIRTRTDHVEAMLKQADKLVTDAQEKADALRREAVDISLGKLPWPPQVSPRQQAIAMGEKWYMPLEVCRHCGEMSERYVANGRCKSCGK